VLLFTHELTKVVSASWSWGGRITTANIWDGSPWPQRFLGVELVCLGVSMISQLIYFDVTRGTIIWTGAPLKELRVEVEESLGTTKFRDAQASIHHR
jgi:hypothetical protein